MAGGKI